MDLAKKASKLDNSDKKFYFGAVIAKGNKIISLGVNSYTKTHTRCRHYHTKAIHAEIQAIFNANTSISGATLYVYRESKAGKVGCSYPCKPCLDNLKRYGLKSVFYLTTTGDISKVDIREIN